MMVENRRGRETTSMLALLFSTANRNDFVLGHCCCDSQDLVSDGAVNGLKLPLGCSGLLSNGRTVQRPNEHRPLRNETKEPFGAQFEKFL